MTYRNQDSVAIAAYPIPTKGQVKTWVREANHNEPMFYQVACMAAEWAANHYLLVYNTNQEVTP
jgi:hypothetical protein